MYKNMKGLFLLTTVLILLVTVSAVAADDAQDSMATDTTGIADDTISGDVDNTVVDNNNDYINKNIQTKEVKKDTATSIVNDENMDELPSGENTLGDVKNAKSIKTAQSFTITDDTYSQFFDEYGELINTEVVSDSTLILDGTFNNKSFIFRGITLTVEGNNAVLNEGQISVFDQAKVIIDNISFVNRKLNNTVIFNTDGNTLKNSKITKTFTNALAREVYITGNNNLVENNLIDITGPSAPVDYNVNPNLSPVIGIAVLSNNNIVQYNNITYTDTRVGFDGSSDLITVSGVLGKAEDNLVTNNNLKAVGSGYLYGLNLGVNANKNNLTNNTLNITSSYYSYGLNILQVPMTDNTIQYNKIYLKADNTAYGVLANIWGAPEASNFRISNNDMAVEAVNAYGMQIAGSDYFAITFKNINITSNTINVTGTYAIGVGLSLTDNVYLYNNTLNIIGQTNETNLDSWDTVQPTTTGVYSSNGNNTRISNELNYDVANGPNVIFKGMTNSLIDNGVFTSNNDNFILEDVENSNITNTDADTISGACVDLINSKNNVIKYNVFVSEELFGNDAVVCDEDSTDNVIESNYIATNVELTPNLLVKDMEGTITANAVGADKQEVTGTFLFTINGQEVLIATGSSASYDLTPTELGSLDVSVEFIPTSSDYAPGSTQSIIDVVAYGAVITMDDITANAGETVTLTANVEDVLGNAITKGKVTFKINGKTVKDTQGKVIYAKVTDGVAQADYLVSDDFAGKNLTVTAIYSGSSGIAKTEGTSTLYVDAEESSIEFENEPVSASVGQTVTFTIKVTGDVSRVVCKLNGKTLKDADGKVIYAKVTDGIATIEYVIPEGMKANEYTLTAVTTGSERLTAEQKLTII
ncbi:Ig-like domain repeat protein [Methanosphaera sp. BMS]|uniref:Ig-like domain repeat protein n=1 Tax=Methanosphaera sp. BMS TaxID=1789762 RepID=UPI000DC1DBCE|nr:Ig-like domain repeat protein [Methanosphaera sp. BMS]AWX32222.1 hypothetical protein AW729_03495 [Methanosphaera sp. BMS]